MAHQRAPRIPDAPRGARVEGLWEYDVVECFVVGADGRYFELELGAGGHYLALAFDAPRRRVRRLRARVARGGMARATRRPGARAAASRARGSPSRSRAPMRSRSRAASSRSMRPSAARSPTSTARTRFRKCASRAGSAVNRAHADPHAQRLLVALVAGRDQVVGDRLHDEVVARLVEPGERSDRERDLRDARLAGRHGDPRETAQLARRALDRRTDRLGVELHDLLAVARAGVVHLDAHRDGVAGADLVAIHGRGAVARTRV